jgi:hypothetical protein
MSYGDLIKSVLEGDKSLSPRRRKRLENGLRAFEHEQALKEKIDRMRLPSPVYRQQIREPAETQWGEPVVAIRMGDVEPEFIVPGRRKDGTVIGKRLIRRFFWNIFRGVVNTVFSFIGGGVANGFMREGQVTGPANAQALGLADAARAAKHAWLVYAANPPGDAELGYSPTHIAVIDSGEILYVPEGDPVPKILWQATKPDAPRINLQQQTLTWPDGSRYDFVINRVEMVASGAVDEA